MPLGGRARGAAYLASIVVDDKASAPAVEMLVGAHGPLQLLQQRLVGATARGVHRGAHVVQDAHDAWGALRAWGGGSSTKSFIRVGVEGVGVQVCVGGCCGISLCPIRDPHLLPCPRLAGLVGDL